MGLNPLNTYVRHNTARKYHSNRKNHHLDKAAHHEAKELEHVAWILQEEENQKRLLNEYSEKVDTARELISKLDESAVIVTDNEKVKVNVKNGVRTKRTTTKAAAAA